MHAALATHGVPAALLVPGTAVAGLGFGGTSQSSLRHLATAIEVHERATVMAIALTMAFTAFGLPSIVAGALIPAFGMLTVALRMATLSLAVPVSGEPGCRHGGLPTMGS